MAIKRTRQEKESPHYQFSYSWAAGSTSQPHVKRETKLQPEEELAVTTAKKDIAKSLILASLILSLEVVVYLAWIKVMP